MNEKLLDWLRCPQCREALSLTGPVERQAHEIKSGSLGCPNGHPYRVHNFIPRFVETDRYTRSFSFQWRAYRQAQLDSVTGQGQSESLFRSMTRFSEADLAGRLALDVGCGPGKFLEVARKWGAEVVGLDLSFAVDAARENFGPDPNLHLVQADVFHPPFAPGVFDGVFSLGVLHHTPDCEQAFRRLPELLKPGGRLAIWVYDQNIVPHFNRRLRSLTRRLPPRLLYWLCLPVVPFTYLFNVPVVRAPLYGLRAYFQWIAWGSWRQRWLDTFDWYSCWYQSAHTYPEVYDWFTEAGLERIALGEIAVSMSGARPCAPAARWTELSQAAAEPQVSR